ncbi:hypothetical protein HOF56_00035 [Candidatus Peribacteria bacterium]|jgi:hypothetical protein|nr:hypothetical protein [Candidatus Peribacteria bacterium]MBT4021281.1 hypothetical protein [Candidatus Peribacteria bacterium]MBT4240346.1 hypothetical protein [Candidatus Peribacteria bacterium]MBT4474057.1 hypothetical protein [Candidatus Peribacteria bacterium]
MDEQQDNLVFVGMEENSAEENMGEYCFSTIERIRELAGIVNGIFVVGDCAVNANQATYGDRNYIIACRRLDSEMDREESDVPCHENERYSKFIFSSPDVRLILGKNNYTLSIADNVVWRNDKPISGDLHIEVMRHLAGVEANLRAHLESSMEQDVLEARKSNAKAMRELLNSVRALNNDEDGQNVLDDTEAGVSVSDESIAVGVYASDEQGLHCEYEQTVGTDNGSSSNSSITTTDAHSVDSKFGSQIFEAALDASSIKGDENEA